VLAPTGRDAALTCSLLQRAGLRGETCASLAELCQRFEADGAAALLVAEEVFVRDGVGRLSAALARQGSWSDVPILIFTGAQAVARPHGSSPQQLSALGNVILLERPLQPISMLSAARSALRARRRQYDARAELLAQQRAVRERDQFLAMLGHELRNPLAAIGMALRLDGDGQPPSKYREIMLRQFGHLKRLVDDLLDVARVTSGKIVLRCEDLDLVALARRCIQQLSPALQAGTTLELQEPSSAVWVRADPVRMEQVINNLLTNAIKYTGHGGKIVMQLSNESEWALLRVRDTGVGLAPEMVERIFELFTQVEGSLDRAQGGMGIGLTLVRNLVALHGGSVSASSAGLGRGSEFSVQLPRAQPAAVGGETRAPEPERTAVGPLRVLIVEDNEDSRELLAAILSQRGYRVLTAEDGRAGIVAALASRPNVLLVDIGLPGIDGYGLAREVRRELGRAVYLVAITGYGQPEDRVRAERAGFDVHLTKPVDIGALERLLSSHVAGPYAS